jgi:glycyl-tRNA synthetase
MSFENTFMVNGLRFQREEDIQLRRMFTDYFTLKMKAALWAMNKAWRFTEIEAPLLTPRALINPNYTSADVWIQEQTTPDETELVLRPETTPGSYAAMVHLMREEAWQPPFVVYQTGKSFRREQEQPSKHCRFKEFYQQEFQCLYTRDTMNDYHTEIQEPVRQMIQDMVHLPTRVVPSDRLPDYSEVTTDIEVDNGDKWMEVCSISRRTDFPEQVRFTTKKGQVVKDVYVLEIAIGVDRCIYNFKEARNAR